MSDLHISFFYIQELPITFLMVILEFWLDISFIQKNAKGFSCFWQISKSLCEHPSTGCNCRRSLFWKTCLLSKMRNNIYCNLLFFLARMEIAIIELFSIMISVVFGSNWVNLIDYISVICNFSFYFWGEFGLALL